MKQQQTNDGILLLNDKKIIDRKHDQIQKKIAQEIYDTQTKVKQFFMFKIEKNQKRLMDRVQAAKVINADEIKKLQVFF